MAYLVKGHTFTSYYDIKYQKVPAQKFMAVYTGVGSEDDAREAARLEFQSNNRQLAVIDSVDEISVDDDSYRSVIDWDLPWYQQRLVAFDVETTGFSPVTERIVEIAFSVFDLEAKTFGEPKSYLVNDGIPVPESAAAVHGISTDMLDGAPSFDELLPTLKDEFVHPGTIFISHNRGFDMGFWLNSCARAGDIIAPPCWCSMELAIQTPVGQEKNRLFQVAAALDVEGDNSHRAGDDAKLAGDVFLALARRRPEFHSATTRQIMDYFDQLPQMEMYGGFRF